MNFFKMLLLMVTAVSFSSFQITQAAAKQDIPAELLAKHSASNECNPLEEMREYTDIITEALDEVKTLYMLPCILGAYNASYALYISDLETDTYRQLIFADYSEELGWTGTTILFNPDFNPETKELSSFAKGRGLGDCGTAGHWLWYGDDFKLMEFRAKDECPIEPMPGELPLIYSARK